MRAFLFAVALAANAPAFADAAPQEPAQTPAAAAAQANPADVPGVLAQKISRVAPSGVERRISFTTYLNPDCTAMDGEIVGRILAPPLHGSIRFGQVEGFPTYRPESVLAHCNNGKVKGLGVFYTANDGYVGDEAASVLIINPDGTAAVYAFTIAVR